jgi:hypothetical protein
MISTDNKNQMEEQIEGEVTKPEIKQELHDFRKGIDACIFEAEQFLQDEQVKACGREMSLVRTKLQEAKMWCGKCLEVLGSELPKEFRDKITDDIEPAKAEEQADAPAEPAGESFTEAPQNSQENTEDHTIAEGEPAGEGTPAQTV